MTAQQVETAIRLRDKGYAWALIAQRFGVTERTVRRSIVAHIRAREEAQDGQPA